MVSQLSLNLFSAVAREGNSNCPPKWTEEHHRQFRDTIERDVWYLQIADMRTQYGTFERIESEANLKVELAEAQKT